MELILGWAYSTVRKYKQARNGWNGVTPKCQVLALIAITIAQPFLPHVEIIQKIGIG